VAVAVELRYMQLDPLKDINLQLVPFAFYDVGKVWNEDRGSEPQQAPQQGLVHIMISTIKSQALCNLHTP
jgi:hemolysin activation/secretion protein